MKKTIFLYLMIFLVISAGTLTFMTLLVSCSSPVRPKDTCTLTFRGNPTTGYGWTHTFIDGDAVELVESTYTPDTHADSGMIAGSGGVYGYTFKAVKEGSAEVLFSYGRAWEEAPAKTVSYIMTVDGSMNLNVKEKEEWK